MTDGIRLDRLEEAFDKAIAEKMIPGAVVGITSREETVYLKPFGYRDREAAVGMTEDTIFRTASMTKPVIAALALSLVGEGRLSLADPIGRYLPQLADLRLGVDDAGTLQLEDTAQPTVLDLLRQTSGFTNLGAGTSPVHAAYAAAPNLRDHQQTNAELVEKLASLPLHYRPGTTFEYGMAMDVLGALLEVVAGEDLDALVRRRICAPLDMADTSFLVRDETRLAEPQVEPETGVRPNLGYRKGEPPKWFRGGGGLLSSTPDYLRFCRMLLNDGALHGHRLLTADHVARMMSPSLPESVAFSPNVAGLGPMAPIPSLGQSFGLGGMVRVNAALAPWPGRSGEYSWWGRTGTYFWIDPSSAIAVVLMMQSDRWRTESALVLRTSIYGEPGATG